MPLVRSYTSQWSSRFHRIPMLLPACSMVYLITLLCGGHLTAPPCIRSLPLLIWSLVHLPIILHMMEMHDTIEVSRGVGCETNMYLFPIVVDFVIDYLSIAEDIVPCDTHGPVVHPDGEELVLQARHTSGLPPIVLICSCRQPLSTVLRTSRGPTSNTLLRHGCSLSESCCHGL